ncbi:MAG TPA: hydrogenase iron-sulfur subunit, partial [Thermodesulfobacteriota bacterium]|nr:hydrogenase iron-sulfur subunit [Thermodesulfobacteriota bacterium]
RLKYAANVLPIRVMCSGRISPHFILKAIQEGADGVLVAGCHIGECHYGKGNFMTAKRVAVMKELMQFIGISPKRLRLEWIATSEGNKFAKVVSEFTEEITQLGPSPLRKKKSPISVLGQTRTEGIEVR